MAAVYLSPLALCTSWKPSWEAPAQSWIEGRCILEASKKTEVGLSGVSCGSGISEPGVCLVCTVFVGLGDVVCVFLRRVVV